jgi:class 3 adenylate cyclase
MSAERASDADRERVVTQLRDHYSAGRLSDGEHTARVDRALTATTVAQLGELTRDLPAAIDPAVPAQPPARYVTRGGRALRTSVKIHAYTYLFVNLLLIGIWAAAGGGYFWPIWSILGWGIGLGAHAAPVLAGAGTRRVRPTSPVELAERVGKERPDLRTATAPDGTVTLLFSDIVGSTELNGRLGDLRWLDVLRRHHELVREQVVRQAGYEVKEQGDGFMVAFPSARKAVLCARGIQDALARELGDHPDGPIQVRVGLHTGEAVREQDDFYGRNVVQAARIASSAEPGETLVSAVVKGLVESAGDLTFGPGREVELKGLGAVTVYPVV